MYWVTMTDKFMSGWGHADGKINKLVLPCETYEEAETVARNAADRTEMKYINICTTKPSYPTDRYFVSWKGPDDYKTWYRKDRPFLRQKTG